MLNRNTFFFSLINNSVFNKMPKCKLAHRKRALVTPESSSKVPEEVRQRYVNLFVEKYLGVYETEDEALNKVSTEQ